jgi:hypothetical protein
LGEVASGSVLTVTPVLILIGDTFGGALAGALGVASGGIVSAGAVPVRRGSGGAA